MQAVAEEVALAKTAAFEAVETERAAVKEAETQDAEVQKAAQETEVEEQVAKAVESQKVKPTTIGDIVTPEVRAGLEKMKAAKVAREAPVEPVEAPTPQLALTDQRADFAVTPAGEAIPKGTEEITIEAPALPGERPTKEAAAIIDAKANQAATSEANNIPMPTEAQLESGQYKKGELGPRDVGMPGVNVAVETPKGSTRRGTRPDGSQWSQKMRDHYGYIRGTESAEGPTEQLDAFIGDNMESDQIFVVDQVNDAGGFDEHKVMIGYANQMDAVRAYKRNNPQGKKVGPVTPMTKEQFTQWLERGDQTRPLSPKMREGQQVLAGEEEFQSLVARRQRQRGKKPVVRYRAEELPMDNAAFDPTETESSDLLLRAEGESAGVVQVRDAQAAIKPITKELKRLKPIIVASPDQLKDKTLLKALRAAGALKAKGVFYDGKLYIFASNHETSADVVRTLLHEGVAHQGLRALFKNEAELNDILDEVYSSMTEDQINSLRGKHRAYANIDLNTLEGQREMAEEHIAELAESDPQQTVIQQLIAKVRSMLRQAGLDVQWTNDDITNLLADARRELRKTIPLNRITVVSSVEVAETGEVIEVEEQADVALRQLTKRMNVIQQLRECQA
ncbi:MAG: hypothetical protein E4H01_09875 [Lysobacterales bacterium]|nr:MAG: hypothetical protein E4H01_09875 [Xanthomonadales bacterium]